MKAASVIVICLIIIFYTPFTKISLNKYHVIVKTDGFQVDRNIVLIINPLEFFKIRDIRPVPLVLEEKVFIELETASYYFIEFEVESKLIEKNDDYHIYVVSHSRASVIDAVGDYIKKLFRNGEENKNIIEQKALAYFKKHSPGYWVPTKIKILSLKKVSS